MDLLLTPCDGWCADLIWGCQFRAILGLPHRELSKCRWTKVEQRGLREVFGDETWLENNTKLGTNMLDRIFSSIWSICPKQGKLEHGGFSKKHDHGNNSEAHSSGEMLQTHGSEKRKATSLGPTFLAKDEPHPRLARLCSFRFCWSGKLDSIGHGSLFINALGYSNYSSIILSVSRYRVPDDLPSDSLFEFENGAGATNAIHLDRHDSNVSWYWSYGWPFENRWGMGGEIWKHSKCHCLEGKSCATRMVFTEASTLLGKKHRKSTFSANLKRHLYTYPIDFGARSRVAHLPSQPLPWKFTFWESPRLGKGPKNI